MEPLYSLVGNKKLWLAILLFIISPIFLSIYFPYINIVDFNPFADKSNVTLQSRSGPLNRLTWTLEAATEAETVAAIDCGKHGRAYVDGIVIDGAPECECNTCYTGSDCSTFLPDCHADVLSGDAQFLEDYWKQHRSKSATLTSGWHRMSYFLPTNDDYKDFISLELEKHIKLLHEVMGNAKTDNRFILFGTGLTQLLNAVIYAISQKISNNGVSSPAKVVAQVPYYPVFKTQTTILKFSGYEWKGNASDFANTNSASDFIEIVTSPSNPDGNLLRPTISGANHVYDLAYYWPHYSPIPAPMDEDIMLFTNSKYSGHAGSRFGWVLIKDEDVYKKVLQYIQVNTVGVSRDTQLRMLKLIKTILADMKANPQNNFNNFGYNALKKRWDELSTLISSSKRFSLQKISPHYCTYFKKVRDPSPAYGWLKCEAEEDYDCEDVLFEGGILGESGILFDADSRYVRLSLIKTQDDFDQMMQRLKVLVNPNVKKQSFKSIDLSARYLKLSDRELKQSDGLRKRRYHVFT